MSEPREKLDISDLKDTFLECPVCVEHFNQTDRRPRILHTCLHAFCTQCLDQLLVKEGKGQITCPLCRRVQKVTKKADTLPLDPVRGKLVEYVQIKHQEKVLCTDCPDEGEAEARCHECHIYLCTMCKDAHKRNKITRKHDIVSLEEMLNEPIKNMMGHYCSHHPDHKIEFYCSHCNEVCCLSCTVVKHKGHDLKAVQDASRDKISDLESKIAQLSITEDEIRKKRTWILETTAKEERKLVSSTTSINKQFDDIIHLLNTRRSSLLSNLKFTSEEIVGSLHKQSQATEDTLAVMDSVKEYFEHMKSKSDDCEIISAVPGLHQTLNIVNSERSDHQYQMTLSFKFPQENIKQIKSLISSLGEIKKTQDTRGVVGGMRPPRTLDTTKKKIIDIMPGIRRSSMDVDVSTTFDHSHRNPTADTSMMLEGKKAGTSGTLSQEARGAISGSGSPTTLTREEIEYFSERDRNEPLSFGSSFAGQESMLRDLDKAPKEELAHIETWGDTGMVGTRPDTRGREAGDFDGEDEVSHETHRKLYGSEHNGQDELDVHHASGNLEIHDQYETRVASKPFSYEDVPSDFTEDVKEYSFKLLGGAKVKVYYGNIVKVKTEGIVNAANGELKNYAGISGAIERACGTTMKRECERYIRLNGPLNISEVMHTGAGDLLETLYILHTVGPVYVSSLDQKCGTLLTMTFQRCLDYARKKLRIESIAFPFISAGVYGTPLDLCVESFLDAVVLFSHSHQSDPAPKEIHLVDTDLEMVQTAIVMIKQHLELGPDVLLGKAMSRLQDEKERRTAMDERSPRSETRDERRGPPRRSSFLTRDRLQRSSEKEDVKRWAEYRNHETGSLRHEDHTTTPPKVTSHRHRSGCLNRVKLTSKERPYSAGSTTGYSSRMKVGTSSRSDVSRAMPDMKYSVGKETDLMSFKARP